jgi:hypothetical protein
MTDAIAGAQTTPCTPNFTLPKDHPAPWSYQDEMGHVVRDANGAVVVRCVKVSKEEEEKLARAIAAIPNMLREITHRRVRNAEMKSTVAKLEAALCALKATAPHAPPARIDDAHTAAAAKLPLSNTDDALHCADATDEGAALTIAKITLLALLSSLAKLCRRLLNATGRTAARRPNRALRDGS